jgi:hypothetical protein
MDTKKNNQICGNVHRRDKARGKASRVGVLIARKNDNNVVVLGWSRCNTAMGDKFNHDQGVLHAEKNIGIPIPLSFQRNPDLSHFRARAARYFRDEAIPAWEASAKKEEVEETA